MISEECDESIYWLELLTFMNLKNTSMKDLLDEGNQILSIIVASLKTARKNSQLPQIRNSQ